MAQYPNWMKEADLKEVARALEELTQRVAALERKLGTAPLSPSLETAQRQGPNLESRLGGQYLNRIGVVALLVGVSFFLHWAFINGWLGPTTLVIMGLLGGLIVLALGRWFLRRKYSAFGLSLEALGMGLLYLVAWAASQLYALVPAAVALGAMVVITASTTVASVIENSETAAMLAAVGGFATPLLLSAGPNQQGELFTYLFLLSLGMLVTAAFRLWQKLVLVTFIGCSVAEAVWHTRYYADPHWAASLAFLTTLLGLLIVGSILVGKRVESCHWPLLIVPPGASLSYVLAVDDMLASPSAGLAVFLLGIVLLALSWRLRERLRVCYFTTGAACVALAIPIAFDTRWTTSGLWLVFGAALVIVGFRRKLTFVRWNALVLLGLTVLKIFIFDLARLGQGYRIVALASLGVALLAISFLYQRSRMRQP